MLQRYDEKRRARPTVPAVISAVRNVTLTITQP